MRENNAANPSKGWENMSCQQMDKLLQAELLKDDPDENTVLGLLEEIRKVDPCEPKMVSIQTLHAWERYKDNVTKEEKPKAKHSNRWLIRCAAVVAVVCMLFAIVPHTVEADSFFGKIVSWAERVFETLTPSSVPVTYVFKTEHPGLQALYDEMTSAGITQPVVPQWIPNELQAGKIKVLNAPFKKRIQTRLTADDCWIMCSFDIYDTEKESNYAKDTSKAQLLEINGIAHYILSNDNNWSAVWIVDNVECTVATSCDKETLIQIICSIYDEEV